MFRIRTRLVWVALIALTAMSTAACTDDDLASNDLASVDEALGASHIRAIRIASSGTRFEPLQTARPGAKALETSTFDLLGTYDLSSNRMHLSWQRALLEPLQGNLSYDEIIAGDAGFIDGVDLALGFGQPRPMTSDRLVAVRRLQHLLNPHLLVRAALRENRTVELARRERIDGVLYRVVSIDAEPRPIEVYIQASGHVIGRVATVEDDPLMGDVAIVVDFADWRRQGGVAFPYDVALRWNGELVHREIRSLIEIDPRVDEDIFTVPASLPFDPIAAELGASDAQWVNRALAIGAPLFLDPFEVVAAPIAPDVMLMAGGTHHTLAIALDSGVVLVEPPLHEARSLAVIDKVAELWPDKPISHMVVTHFHYDHSGGIRTYAAIGATLVVAEGDRPFFAEVVARPHEVLPDLLAGSEVDASFLTVGDRVATLGEDDLRVEIHRIPSPHSAENLVVYLPESKLVFNSDLYSPGLFPLDAPPAPPFDDYAVDFRAQLEALGLDIEWLVGGHGATEARPWAELVDHTGGPAAR